MNAQIKKALALILVLSFLTSVFCLPSTALPLTEAESSTDAVENIETTDQIFNRITQDCAILNYVDEETFKNAGHVNRLTDEEDLYSYVFENADGTRTAYIMGEPVKYLDNDQIKDKRLSFSQKNVSNTSLLSGKAELSAYEVTETNSPVSFPADLADGVQLSYGGYTVKLCPETLSKSIFPMKTDTQIIYRNAFGSSAHLAYTPQLSGLKEDILLETQPQSNTFTFLLDTDGLIPVNTNGNWRLTDLCTPETCISLGQVVAYDVTGKFSIGSITIEPIEKSIYRLSLIVDAEFLSSPNTAYPVIIDPTLTVNADSTSIEDALVFSGKPTMNFGTWLYNTVGYYDNNYLVGRTLFRLPGLYNSATFNTVSTFEINSAEFTVKEASGTAEQTVHLYPLTSNESWTESGVTWNTVGSYDSTYNCTAKLSYNRSASFDITDLVTKWKDGTYSPRAGFILIGNESAYKQIHSGESSSGRPCVVLNYDVGYTLPGTFAVGIGASKEVPLTSYPTTVTSIWTSEDPSIATIDENGHVVGVSLGITKLNGQLYSVDDGTCAGSASVYVRVIPIPEGQYFIENKQLEKFIDNKGDSLSIDYISGMDAERWNLSYMCTGNYHVEGFYLIESVSDPGKYLTVNQNDTQANASVILGTVSTSNYARWRFTEKTDTTPNVSTDDVYTLATVKSSGTGLVLSMYEDENENDDVPETTYHGIPKQEAYTNNTNYADEWTFHPVYISLPTSGSEIAYEPWKWNVLPIQENTNCYAYILNTQERPDGNFSSVHVSESFVIWPGISLDNGWVFGSQCTPYDNTIIQYTTADAEEIGFTFENIGRYDICDPGCYKVALVIDTGCGYHWYRQNPDGTWSHKENSFYVTNLDSSGNVIYDPLTADRLDCLSGDFESFVGYFQVSPLNEMIN